MVLVLGAALIVGGAWMLVLKPQRAELGAVTTQLTQERERLDAALAQAADGRNARARYATDYAAVARLGKAVPPDDDLPALIVQLQSAAEGAKIDFRSVKLVGTAEAPPAGAAANVAAVGAAEQAPGKDGAAGAAAAPAPGAPAPPTAAAATQTAAAGLPPGASIGPAGIATMPFSFAFQGSFLNMQQFLSRVQEFIAQRDGGLRVSGRLLTIDGIGIGPGDGGFPRVRAAITATAYVLPAEQGLTAGASPQAPAPGAPAPGMTAAPAPGSGVATPMATAGSR